MEDDPISSSYSDEESPPHQATQSIISAASSKTYEVPPPRKKINTRRQTTLYGTLSSGKSKKELLAIPRFSTSMRTKEDARRILIENELLPLDQAPDLSSLCTALLHLERSISALTAPGAQAIRAVAIILDSFSLAGNTLPSSTSSPLPIRYNNQAQQTETETTLSAALSPIEEIIQELHEASERNRNSAEMLARAIDEARGDIHNSADLVTSAADEITNAINRRTETLPTQEAQDIIGSIQEIKEMIKERPQAQTHSHSMPKSYKDALTNSRTSTHSPNYPPSELVKASAAIKERQILLDLGEDHTIKKQCLTRDEILTTFQKALTDIQTPDSPDTTIKSLKILSNGGLLLELPSNDAANWVRQNDNRQRFANTTGGKLTIKDRSFNIVVPFTPIWIALEDETTLRNMEKDNGLPEGTIASARWIKPPSKREAFQRFAHALLSLTSPTAANKLIQDGLHYNSLQLRPIKDKKDPLRCLKCQRWGHLAKSCKEEKDTCGSCAGEHRTSSCPSTEPPRCINCDSPSHASASRKCPEFLKRSEELNAKRPENLLPYFPTDEPWTLDPLPPPSSGPIVPPRRPSSPSQATRRTTRTQTSLSNYYTSNRPAILSTSPSSSTPQIRPPTPTADISSPPIPPTPNSLATNTLSPPAPQTVLASPKSSDTNQPDDTHPHASTPINV